MDFVAGDGVDVKALTKAYERKINCLKVKPLEELRRRVFHSASFTRTLSACAEALEHEESSKRARTCEENVDPFENDEAEVSRPQKGQSQQNSPRTDARFTGKLVYYPIGYNYRLAEEFRVVLEEFREALRLKKNLLKPAEEFPFQLPEKEAPPNPDDLLKNARRKLKRAVSCHSALFYEL
ncbi:hypothetical protein L596_018124 [Steinernema carpocapsae]|uniref:Uncharacterized protein n=1 Tax=Steinernema carpocapsae TaxID=34508 RepID=A0A4U5N419_STECR|nr:hypothetical protein L596_018124 [Steinernema carpocapsae]